MTRTWTFVLAIAAGLFCTDSGARERLMVQPEPGHTTRDEKLTAPSAPAASEWTYLGPERAEVLHFAISPIDSERMLGTNSYYLGIPFSGRVLDSYSGGEAWSVIDEFVTRWGQVTFASDGTAVVATEDGVFANEPAYPGWWTERPNPDTFAPFAADFVAGEHHAGGAVWMAGFANEVARVYRVDDLASSWVDVTPSLPETVQLHGLATSETTPGHAVLAFRNDNSDWMRTLVTQDGGATWTESPAVVGNMRTINALRLADDRIYLGWGRFSVNWGLMRGDGFGQTWTLAYGSGGSNHTVWDIAIDRTDTDRLWIATPTGVVYSPDAGDSWQAGTGEVMGQHATVVRHDASTGRLWVGAHRRGMWMSPDEGASFEYRSHGFNTLPVSAMAIHPTNPAQVTVAHTPWTQDWWTSSVSHSANGGLDWIWEFGAPSHVVPRVRIDETGETYLVGTGGNPGLFRRIPNGWQPLGQMVFQEVQDLSFGDAAGTLVVSERKFDWGAEIFDNNIYRYDIGQAAWQLVLTVTSDSDGFRQLERVRTQHGWRVLAREDGITGASPSRLLASDDDGRTWFELDPVSGSWDGNAICVNDAGSIVMATHNIQPRLYRSEDGGDTWRRTDWTPTTEQRLAAPITALDCPRDGSELFIGDRRGNIWYSTDGGDSVNVRLSDSTLWGQQRIVDLQSSPVGLYAAHDGGLWVNTEFAQLPVVPTDLSVRVVSARMRTLATLEWVGGGERVDIRRNGALVASVANTGRHVDGQLTPLRLPVTTWQVCNAGTDACSEPVQH